MKPEIMWIYRFEMLVPGNRAEIFWELSGNYTSDAYSQKRTCSTPQNNSRHNLFYFLETSKVNISEKLIIKLIRNTQLGGRHLWTPLITFCHKKTILHCQYPAIRQWVY